MPDRPPRRMVRPSLESLYVRAKYKVFSDFNEFLAAITPVLKQDNYILGRLIGGAAEYVCDHKSFLPKGKEFKDILEEAAVAWDKMRPGAPYSLSMTTTERQPDGIIIEVDCRPVMYFRIAQTGVTEFPDYMVEDALIECQAFIKEVMSIVRTEEIQPPSIYPIIPRREIKGRLENLGLKEIVDLLDRSERHIIQKNFEESLRCSRTAFEKMISYEMEKRRLEKTDTTGNDIARMASKGFLDKDTAEMLRSYYRCLSNIAVHEKGARPGIYEAQMGYGLTLIILEYMANKFV